MDETGKDARVGELYIRIHKMKMRLGVRESDAQERVNVMRILADCLDPDKPEETFLEIKGGRFRCEASELARRKGKDPWLNFPVDVDEVATEMAELRQEIAELEKRLACEMGGL